MKEDPTFDSQDKGENVIRIKGMTIFWDCPILVMSY